MEDAPSPNVNEEILKVSLSGLSEIERVDIVAEADALFKDRLRDFSPMLKHDPAAMCRMFAATIDLLRVERSFAQRDIR